MGEGQSVILCPQALPPRVPEIQRFSSGPQEARVGVQEDTSSKKSSRIPREARSLCCALWRHLLEHRGLLPVLTTQPWGPAWHRWKGHDD